MNDKAKELLNDLVRLNVPAQDVEDTRRILESCADIADTLGNPLVTHDEKNTVISKIFPESMHKFIMSVVRSGEIGSISEIFDEYTDILLEKEGSIRAVVRYVTPLTESQQADLRKFIMEKFVKDDVGK